MTKLPHTRTMSRHAKDLGPDMWRQFKALREKYKKAGLTPRQAVERAATELKLIERWEDWRERREIGKLAGAKVPLTPEEVKKIAPSYVPATETRAERVGNREMTFAEEVLWARDHRAMVENGSDPPTDFPSKGALSWYQYALVNREKFMQHVASVSKPTGDGVDLYLQDGQYQFKEIARQLEMAVKEVSGKLMELEEGFVDVLKGALNADAT